MSISCGSKKADPYSEEEEALLSRVSQFWLKQCDGLPAAHKVTKWNVYWLYKSLFGHYSLMFESHETGNAFLIELLKGHNIDNDRFEVEMKFRLIDVHNAHYSHLKQAHIGTTENSAYQIFIVGMK